MRADLSRGHRPDEKRGQRYRRVLTQQGRLWLDSDVAASVDATDRLLRHLAKDTGCPAGSPDTGYLATPGPAFAWFDSVDHVDGLPPHGDPFRAFRDYAVKYLERFPSLYLDARAATQALTIHGRRAFQVAQTGKLRLWVKLAPGATPLALSVNGVNVPAPAPVAGAFGFDAYDYDIAAANIGAPEYDAISVRFAAVGPSNEAWIGFIEAFEAASSSPRFWITEGRYYVDGLEVEWIADASSPTFLDPYAALPAGTQFVAYVEAWERLVTHVEEGGLRDSALGGLDTTLRTRPMGQVKIAMLQGVVPPHADLALAISEAFHQVDFGSGELDVKPAVSPPNPDPCAIPVEGGYNADENRLYRFEVHAGGDLGAATIKWSRNNGSELYGASVVDAASGRVAIQSTPGTAPPMRLVENDLVEIITESIDLNDEAPAAIVLATPSVIPAERRVGHLCLVKTTNIDGEVQLCDLATKTPIDFTAVNAPPQPARLRKWDGIIASTVAPSKHTIEDGLDLELSGSDFRPGDYWQFEARRLGNNANSPWQIERHGPERLLAPLALFEIGAGAAEPTTLQHWFDDRFRPICELRADDIFYDGDKSDTEADTVQEAIDELYELVEKGGGCCDFTLSPPSSQGADDTARLQDLVDEIETRGKICLERGVYNLFGTIVIDKKHVTIEGCPEAIILATAENGPVFELGESAGVALEKIFLRATGTFGIVQSRPLTGAGEIPENRITVDLREAWLFHVGTGAVIRDALVAEPTFALNTDDPWPFSTPFTNNLFRVRAEESVLCGRCGVLTDRSALVELSSSVVSATRVGLLSLWDWGARIVLRDSRVTCDWLDQARAEIANAAPEELGALGPRVLEYSVAFEKDSAAVAAEGPIVEVVRSRVGGDAGVLGNCVLLADDAAFEGARASAVFASGLNLVATETTFRSDNVTVHGLSPMQVQLEGCRIIGNVGVVLGLSTDRKNVFPIYSDQIRIAGCQFEPTWTSEAQWTPGGVLIGGLPSSLAQAPDPCGAESIALEIVDNRFSCASVQPGSFAISVALKRSSNVFYLRKTKHRIEDNVIGGYAAFGICVRGTEFFVARNDVGLSTRDFFKHVPEHASLAVFGGGSSVVGDNTVHLFAEKQTVDARGITLLGFVEDARDGIVVRNNGVEVHPESTGDVRPLVVDGPATAPAYQGLVIENNDLEGSRIDLLRTASIVVRANRLAVEDVRLPNAARGTFQENRVKGRDVGRVELSGLTGDWTVDHNECSKLDVLPRTSWVFVLGDVFTTFPMAMNALLLRPTRISPEELERDLRAALRGLTDKEVPAGIEMLPTATDAESALTVALALELGGVFEELAGELAALWALRENAYRVHVADNIVTGALVVGHPPQPGPPVPANAASWVQVLGNQVGQTLSVNQYAHSVVAHNLAADLSPPPLGGTTAAITVHNHNA